MRAALMILFNFRTFSDLFFGSLSNLDSDQIPAYIFGSGPKISARL